MEERERGTLPGVGVVEVAPRAARARARRGELAARPLVPVAGELRVVSLVWLLVGLACVVAAAALGSLGRLSPLEVWASAFALFLPPLATVGALALGRRTSVGMFYRFLLDRAPPPPPGRDGEPWRRTAVRAAVAAACLGVGLLPFAALGLAFELAVFGKPRGEISRHLAQEASLVDGIWLLVCAAAAAQVARWILRWEQTRGRVALCPPLHAGLMSHVYFTAGGRPPGSTPR
jgi:hypothetical protein